MLATVHIINRERGKQTHQERRIILQNQDGKNIFNAISSFFDTFKIGNLPHKYNARKEKGVLIIDIFKYNLCNVFSGRSMYS